LTERNHHQRDREPRLAVGFDDEEPEEYEVGENASCRSVEQ